MLYTPTHMNVFDVHSRVVCTRAVLWARIIRAVKSTSTPITLSTLVTTCLICVGNTIRIWTAATTWTWTRTWWCRFRFACVQSETWLAAIRDAFVCFVWIRSSLLATGRVSKCKLRDTGPIITAVANNVQAWTCCF